MVNEEALIARAKPHFGSFMKRRRFFGKNADLGCLYDAKTDRYISFSLFKHNPCLLPSLVKTNEKANNVSGSLFGRTYDTRLEFLSLQTELKTSALVKMVDSDGCLKVIDDETENVGIDQVQGVLFHETSSREEELNLENDLKTTKKKSLISTKDINAAIKNKLATHVVVGIRWGVSILVNFSHAHTHLNQASLQDKVSKILARIWPCVENHTKFWPTPDEEQTLNGLKFKLYASNSAVYSPDSIDSLIDLLSTLPTKLAQDNNQGRGFPIELELMPVHEFKKLFAIPGGKEEKSSGCACCASSKKAKSGSGSKYKHSPDHYEELSYDLTYHIDKVFEKYLETHKKLTDVGNEVSSAEARATIEQKKKELNDGLAILRRDLSPLLVKLRSGEHDKLKEVHTLLERYENNSYYSPQAVTKSVDDYDHKQEVKLIGERQSSIRDHARIKLTRLTKSNSNLSSVLKAEEREKIQSDKEYLVLNAVNGGCLDGGPLSHIWHGMDAVEQTKYLVEYVLWRFVAYGDQPNTYLVQSVQHDGYLNSDPAHLWYGTIDENPNGVESLLWEVVSTSNSSTGFYLRSVRTGAYLDGQSSGHLWTSGIDEAEKSDRACIEWELLAPSRNQKLVLAKKN